ncbi:chemotaxis protein CheC [Sulfobacillus thermosulfidooxidans]|uniref:chemotaxis protein CheC n=1 Tax=Sulfobacillus thermosulfidooxidans TaxID=28034 RepID=UPI00030EC083|nr:chemotaxis protein CheC [Sulfobacillus thermosulfidooxidans]
MAHVDEVLTIWGKICGPGLDEAGRALSQMTGLDFTMEDKAVNEVAWGDVLKRFTQQDDTEYYVVHLGATGLLTARIMLILSPENGQRLVSTMMGEDTGLPLDEVGLSALAEMGNVVGTAFLNVFANIFGTVFEPTVPEVKQGSGIDVFPLFSNQQRVLITEAIFRVTGETLTGEILIVPERLQQGR